MTDQHEPGPEASVEPTALMALRANVTNDEVLRQREFVDVLSRIKGE